MFSLDWQWWFIRAGTLSLVMIVHIPLVILSIIALVRGSGGYFQIATIVLDSLVLAVIAISLLVKAIYLKRRRDRKVDLRTFGSVTSFNFILLVILLYRREPPTSDLVDDYASIDGSSGSVVIVISLATFGLIFSCLGLAATVLDDYAPEVEREGRRPLRPPFGLSHSLSSLRPMSPELSWDGKARRAYLPDGTPAKLVTAPTHVDQ